ncbi:mitochondrial Homoaconitase, partial [Physocladia obscura]
LPCETTTWPLPRTCTHLRANNVAAANKPQHVGVKLILAGSLSEKYKRNAINNGLLCLEAPEIVDMLSEEIGGRGAGKGTVRIG